MKISKHQTQALKRARTAKRKTHTALVFWERPRTLGPTKSARLAGGM